MKRLLSLLFLFGFVASAVHGAIRIGGSDLMEPHLREAIEEHLDFSGEEVEFDLSGTYRAEREVREGELDLAFLAIPDGEEISEDGLRLIPFAYKVVVPAVSEENPLNEISMNELGAIFGDAESASINRWGQLGLSGDWAARNVAPTAVTPVRQSLALDLFRHAALRSPRLRRGINYEEDLEGIERRFSQETNAIALLPQLLPAGMNAVKVLPVSKGGEERAVTPSAESVHSGEYPLRLPIYLAFSPENGGELREVLRFLVGAEAAAALEAAGLMPIPELHRQRLYFEFERL